LRLRAPRDARPAASEAALRARAAFWDAFYAERYDAIPGLLRQLGAAVLENPRDAETVLLLAHTHLWKVAERARVEVRDPTITDHLVLAEHYFEEAYRLNPDDHRIIGWLGSVRVPLGAIRQDPVLAAEGARLLLEGVHRYPQFNLFTAAFSRAGLPADNPLFRDALDQLWRNVDVCSGVRDGDVAAARTYELALRADRSCANSSKAPHNFEGFVLNLGDMLVKAGRPDDAVSAYARARLAPTYAAWPYSDLLEERIRNAADAARRAREGQPVPMMSGSAYSCAACHTRR
jgi:tetratricopeptide (TPR) repeat protein